MRFTVHAKLPSGPVEFELTTATAIDAASKARKLVAAGATGVYVYDDETDATYWPDRFADLLKVSSSDAKT